MEDEGGINPTYTYVGADGYATDAEQAVALASTIIETPIIDETPLETSPKTPPIAPD